MIMENNPLILSIATFFVIILLYSALSSFLSVRRREQELLKRTERWSEKTQNSFIPGEEGVSPKKNSLFSLFKFPGKHKASVDSSIYSDTPLFYQRAGIYNPNSIRTYQSLRYLLLVCPAIILVASYFMYSRPLNGLTMLAALLAGYVGYVLPVIWLRVLAHYRKKELNRTFPDAMDLLMVSVEAGMGIDSAIRRVSQEIYITSPELAKEFKILSLELKTGKSRNSCLKNLAKRADLPDVDNLVSLLIQAEKYGTGVANALKIHAEEMRQKRYSRLEELAAKLPVKLVVPLILFIFPAFFVVIAGPAAIQVLRVIIQG